MAGGGGGSKGKFQKINQNDDQTNSTAKPQDDSQLEMEIAVALLDLKGGGGVPKQVISGIFPELPLFGYNFFNGTEFPPLPPSKSLRGIIGICSKPFEKQLTNGDLNSGSQSGLYLLKNVIKEAIFPLMSKMERENLDDEIDVTVYDSKENPYDMIMKNCCGVGSISISNCYVLTVGWTRFCDHFKLIAIRDWITVWGFRHNFTWKLCFLLTCRRR